MSTVKHSQPLEEAVTYRRARKTVDATLFVRSETADQIEATLLYVGGHDTNHTDRMRRPDGSLWAFAGGFTYWDGSKVLVHGDFTRVKEKVL